MDVSTGIKRHIDHCYIRTRIQHVDISLLGIHSVLLKIMSKLQITSASYLTSIQINTIYFKMDLSKSDLHIAHEY